MNKQTIQFASGLVVAFFLGLLAGTSSWIPSQFSFGNTDTRDTTHLMIDFSDGTIITCEKTLPEDSTVLDLLETCSEDSEKPFLLESQDYPDLGVFIKQIDDKIAGQDNKYWMYWVNHQEPRIGAGAYTLKGGEYVEWKFLTSQY